VRADDRGRYMFVREAGFPVNPGYAGGRYRAGMGIALNDRWRPGAPWPESRDGCTLSW
jgi:hypothetical protein